MNFIFRAEKRKEKVKLIEKNIEKRGNASNTITI